MKAVAIIGGIVMFGIGGLGLSKATMGPGFDYDTATPIERQAWLDEQVEPIAEDVRKGLGMSGVSRARMDLHKLEISDEEKLIDIQIVAKGATRTAKPTNFREQFLEKTCPTFENTKLARLGFRTRLRIVRENGDIALSESVSRASCQKFREYKKRRRDV